MPVAISIDKSRRNTSAGHNGILKEVNGVNGLPISLMPGFPDLEDQFNQMGITYMRLHDGHGIGDFDESMNGASSQLQTNVPVQMRRNTASLITEMNNRRSLYPNAAAGMRANNLTLALSNANYQMTDGYLRRTLQNNPALNPGNIQRDVMFRLGRTSAGGHEMPQNFQIYAEMAGRVAERYGRDFANIGLPRKIQYWEIWNEPDLTSFWNSGNPQNYYQFYQLVANRIKAADPSAKVGGAGVANGYNPGGAYLDGLLNFCRSTGTPIDFLSWHYYANNTADPLNIMDCGASIQNTLNRYNYGNIESICTEWNSTPFTSINVNTKVQTAKNAAFIISTLAAMQYTKVDKAYYYRGDSLSFGLYNDNDNPARPGFKSFCTYGAQAFSLFARIFETPYILVQNQNFSSGVTSLACENEQGNKINILVGNYKVESYFTSTSPPRETGLYQQHYVDGNRPIQQLTDQWSLNEWFGGVNPLTVTPNNYVPQNGSVQGPPVLGSLSPRARNYSASDSGVSFSIQNVGYSNATIRAYRIREGGDLAGMAPPEVSAQISQTRLANNTLVFTDTNATPSTVTLYTIDLSGNAGGGGGGVVNPGGGNAGGGNAGGGNAGGGNAGGGNAGGGNAGGGNAGGGNIGAGGGGNAGGGNNAGGGPVNYTLTISGNYVRLPLRDFLPPNYYFEANRSYRLTIKVGSNGDRGWVLKCPNALIYDGVYCTVAAPGESFAYSYSSKNNVFVPFRSGILHADPSFNGQWYVYSFNGGVNLVTCSLIPL